MRKALAILIILIFTVPVILSYSWLQFKISVTKHEVKESIIKGFPDEDLVLLKFSKQESNSILKWEHEEEFEFNDEKYDVVRSEFRGDSILFWCWHDQHETQLSKKIDYLISGIFSNNHEKQQQKSQFDRFFKTLYLNIQDQISAPSSSDYSNQNFYYALCLDKYEKELLTPPPKHS